MEKQSVTITNPTGIHARPASLLVGLCQKFQSEIVMECADSGRQVNPKSIFSVLSGRLKPGTTVTVAADGEDARQAVQEICAFIETLEE